MFFIQSNRCHEGIAYQFSRPYLEYIISDKVVLKLIWKFLRSGILDGDNSIKTTKGAPQGGPLSPILANVYLDIFDMELEKRGHRFIRYIDDFVIYVKSKRAGERVMESATNFLEEKLGLTINQEKSEVRAITKANFLGFNLQNPMGKWDADLADRLKSDLRK